MRVALTGADGFTGTYLRAEFARLGIQTEALRADLTDPEAVRAEIEGASFECVVHLAGEAFAASREWRRFYEVNLLGTLTLLGAVAERRPGMRCILASSAAVYGPAATGVVTEEQLPRPSSHYGFSKLAMEICADAFSDQLDIVVTRPFNYTGVGQQVQYVVPKIVDHFRRRADRIQLGNIDTRRDFGDVRSVAEAYAGLAIATSSPPVLNISTGRDHSIREIIAIASELSGHELKIDVNPAFVRVDEVPLLVGDHQRLLSLLPEWTPRPIESTIAWMLALQPSLIR